MNSEDTSFTFRLPNTLLEAAKKVAERSDLSVAQVVRKAVREFVECAEKGGE